MPTRALRPGDIALVRSHGVIGWIIRIFTESRYNHNRLVVGSDGLCIEAVASGAVYSYVQPTDVIVSPPLTDEQRERIPAIAFELRGTPYGWIDVAAVGLARLGLRLPWLKKRVARYDRLFCSQLADFAIERAGYHLFDDGRLPQNVSPGDLADLAFRSGWPRSF